jgi:hypothetical protein
MPLQDKNKNSRDYEVLNFNVPSPVCGHLNNSSMGASKHATHTNIILHVANTDSKCAL